jgi:acetyl esterase
VSVKRAGFLMLCVVFLSGCVSAVETMPILTTTIVTAAAATQQTIATDVTVDGPDAAIGRGPKMEVYKTVNDARLEAYIFFPPGFKESDTHPAFLFFHGGGWFEGGPENGFQLCEYWAARGMVAISFEYRLANFNDISPIECVADAKSAIRWVRVNAAGLGIDPDRIVATGGSAGGHLAVSTAILDGFEDAGEDLSVRSFPDAVIVWSAAVNVGEDSWFAQLLGDRADVGALSPANHIRSGLPPMALLHGTEDATVPYWTIAEFVDEMQQAGNRCELYTYEGGGHTFHVGNRAHVLGVIEAFLISIGYLD